MLPKNLEICEALQRSEGRLSFSLPPAPSASPPVALEFSLRLLGCNAQAPDEVHQTTQLGQEGASVTCMWLRDNFSWQTLQERPYTPCRRYGC